MHLCQMVSASSTTIVVVTIGITGKEIKEGKEGMDKEWERVLQFLGREKIVMPVNIE